MREIERWLRAKVILRATLAVATAPLLAACASSGGVLETPSTAAVTPDWTTSSTATIRTLEVETTAAPAAVAGWLATAAPAPLRIPPDLTDLPGTRRASSAPAILNRNVREAAGVSIVKAALAFGRTVPQPQAVPGEEAFKVVEILWATNRAVARPHRGGTGAAYKPIAFGSERTDELRMGIAKVTVPTIARAPGEVPVPRTTTFLSIELYREKENPRSHFTIARLDQLSESDVAAVAGRMLESSGSFRNQCLVYVHGFNNTFQDALYRMAQVVVDMSFDGAPFIFSWPSKGGFAGYVGDRDAVDASQVQFGRFLDFIGTEAGCAKIHIIAHSMGTRLVVDALFPPHGRSSLLDIGSLDQIVLAAPDIDAGVLRSRAKAIGASARTLTLYAHEQDAALNWSKWANNDYVRAGDLVRGRPLVMPGVESIDLTPMSNATFVFFNENHSAYAEHEHALGDIALLMQKGVRPPDVRNPGLFERHRVAEGAYWRYVPN
jgi:esterase/lipase superfamily enzyme